jgi:hypothetical protein
MPSDFWTDEEYFKGPPLTDELVAQAEAKLGYSRARIASPPRPPPLGLRITLLSQVYGALEANGESTPQASEAKR